MMTVELQYNYIHRTIETPGRLALIFDPMQQSLESLESKGVGGPPTTNLGT